MDTRATGVIERALAGQAPNYNEVVYLLKLDEASPEATAVRGAANDIVRAKTKNSGIMYGQIGVDVYPCEADCKFCSFGKSSTHFTEHTTMPLDEVVERARAFTQGGDLYGLWIMTMNSYGENYFIEVIKAVRASIPDNVVLFSNIGDTDVAYFRRLKEAGLDGAYHVIRLGEGEFTSITPERRQRTIDAAVEAGLRIQDCLEPIGAEHTAEELADHLFKTVEKGCKDSGVMKRIAVPGTPFADPNGQITDLRLGLITAVNALAMIAVSDYPWIAIHEANSIGLVSGGNSICAETGINPRDTAADTASGRGLDVPAVRSMFYEAGFKHLVRGDGSMVDLTPDYMAERR